MYFDIVLVMNHYEIDPQCIEHSLHSLPTDPTEPDIGDRAGDPRAVIKVILEIKSFEH